MIDKMRIVLPALAFCFALALGAASVQAQDDAIAAKMACPICSQFMTDMELLTNCDYHICNTSDGIVCQAVLKDTKLMDRMREFIAKDKDLCKVYGSMPRDKRKASGLCTACGPYFDLMERGMKEERVETPSGAIHIMRSDDPKLVADIHAWADGMRKEMASCEITGAAAGEKACCGTCTGDAEAKSGCDGCSTTCGDAAKAKSSGCGSSCGHDHGASAEAKSCCGTCSEEAAPVAEIPDFMLNEMKKCHLCKIYAANPAMMTACKSEVTFLEHGMVFTNTVIDPKNLKAYQKFETDFHKQIDDLAANHTFEEANKKLCQICQQFNGLNEAGALMDWSTTPTGSISVFTSKDPKVAKKIITLGKMIEGMMKMNPMNQ